MDLGYLSSLLLVTDTSEMLLTKRFIRKEISSTTPTESEHVENKTDALSADTQSDDAASNTPTRRSSTRVKRAPERLKDYIVGNM